MRIEKENLSAVTGELQERRRNASTMRGTLVTALLLSLSLALAACGDPEPVEEDLSHIDLKIGSSEPGGGALVMDYDFSLPFEVFESTAIGGFTLWSGSDPGFVQLDFDEPGEGIYALPEGVTVSLEVTALEDGTQFQFAGATLNEVGESVPLGTTPYIHAHGEWQVILPDGVEDGEYTLSFRFVTDDGYDPSETETAVMTPIMGSHDDHDDHDHGDHDDHDGDHDDHDGDHDDHDGDHDDHDGDHDDHDGDHDDHDDDHDGDHDDDHDDDHDNDHDE